MKMVQRKKERLLELRHEMNVKRPSFRRVESWRYKRVKDSWRKARGIDSKTRKKKKSGVKSPSTGYRGPKKVRGLHPSGFKEVRIFTINDLEDLNKREHVIKISSKIGLKKRMILVEEARNRGLKVLNIGVSQKEMESFESMLESSELEDEELDDSLEIENEDK